MFYNQVPRYFRLNPDILSRTDLPDNSVCLTIDHLGITVRVGTYKDPDLNFRQASNRVRELYFLIMNPPSPVSLSDPSRRLRHAICRPKTAHRLYEACLRNSQDPETAKLLQEIHNYVIDAPSKYAPPSK